MLEEESHGFTLDGTAQGLRYDKGSAIPLTTDLSVTLFSPMAGQQAVDEDLQGMIEHQREQDERDELRGAKISIASGTPMARVFLTEQK